MSAFEIKEIKTIVDVDGKQIPKEGFNYFEFDVDECDSMKKLVDNWHSVVERWLPLIGAWEKVRYKVQKSYEHHPAGTECTVSRDQKELTLTFDDGFIVKLDADKSFLLGIDNNEPCMYKIKNVKREVPFKEGNLIKTKLTMISNKNYSLVEFKSVFDDLVKKRKFQTIRDGYNQHYIDIDLSAGWGVRVGNRVEALTEDIYFFVMASGSLPYWFEMADSYFNKLEAWIKEQ